MSSILHFSSLFKLSHFWFLYIQMHFSLTAPWKSIRTKLRVLFRDLRVILIKVYLEFSIACLLGFALTFHITHLIIKNSRRCLNCLFPRKWLVSFVLLVNTTQLLHKRLNTEARRINRLIFFSPANVCRKAFRECCLCATRKTSISTLEVATNTRATYYIYSLRESAVVKTLFNDETASAQ